MNDIGFIDKRKKKTVVQKEIIYIVSREHYIKFLLL